MGMQDRRKNNLIEPLLEAAGWSIQDSSQADFQSAKGLALRGFPLARGCGEVDYLLFLNGKAAGLIALKDPGSTVSGLEAGAEKYRRGLPFTLPLYTRPLPFLYESSGEETQFTNGFDPDPQPRKLFAFHKPETLMEWMEEGLVGGHSRDMATDAFPEYAARGMTLLHRLWINMPPPPEDGHGAKVIAQLEASLRRNHRRTLILIKDRSEHIPTALRIMNRLLKFAGAHRVLWLFNEESRIKEGIEALQEVVAPKDFGRLEEKSSAEKPNETQRETAPQILISSPRQAIDLLQQKVSKKQIPRHEGQGRMESDTHSLEIKYTPEMPIEAFDFIFIDEAKQSDKRILKKLAGYFDAYLIGFSSDSDDKTRRFFQQNIIMEHVEGEKDENRVNVSFEL